MYNQNNHILCDVIEICSVQNFIPSDEGAVNMTAKKWYRPLLNSLKEHGYSFPKTYGFRTTKSFNGSVPLFACSVNSPSGWRKTVQGLTCTTDAQKQKSCFISLVKLFKLGSSSVLDFFGLKEFVFIDRFYEEKIT